MTQPQRRIRPGRDSDGRRPAEFRCTNHAYLW
jgi:hypothetical protein